MGLVKSVDQQRLEWGAKLDQRVGLVVSARGRCFAVGAEIGVVADGALVAVTSNICLPRLAGTNSTIAIDAFVNLLLTEEGTQLLINRSESVTSMNLGSHQDTSRAIVKVWATQTLVTDSIDRAITAITDSLVFESAALLTQMLDVAADCWTGNVDRLKDMGGMVSMLTLLEAEEAEIVVSTVTAGDE